ncbi:MAG: hypothetical protein WCA45_07030 [Thiobacillaceae bacterium]
MPLFSDKPAPSPSVVLKSSAPLTKDQKAFNNLIKRIEARRARLADWDTAIPLFKQKYVSDLLPLEEQEMDLQFRLAQALDSAHQQKGLTKGERRKLAVMIVDLAEQVLEHREHGELKALYNKHAQSDFDAEDAARLDGMKSMLEDILGVDLGEDADMRSAEDVLKRVESQYSAQQEEWEAKQARRKKSAKQQAQEARLEAEEKQISQSIREVYRKLASSLHPDREPDPAEKQRKTELMQHANEAYEKGNLLQLLELQLQLEHIDQAHLAAIGPERLKHYLKILRDQLSELDMEIQHVEAEFAAEFGLTPFAKHDPKGLMPMLKADMAACEVNLAQLRQYLEEASDLKQLKAWLKTITLQREPAHDFDLPF